MQKRQRVGAVEWRSVVGSGRRVPDAVWVGVVLPCLRVDELARGWARTRRGAWDEVRRALAFVARLDIEWQPRRQHPTRVALEPPVDDVCRRMTRLGDLVVRTRWSPSVQAWIAASASRLLRLDLSGCSVPVDVWAATASPWWWPTLPNLTTLRLVGVTPPLADPAPCQSWLAHQLPSLTSFDGDWAWLCRPRGRASVLAHWPRLRDLGLTTRGPLEWALGPIHRDATPTLSTLHVLAHWPHGVAYVVVPGDPLERCVRELVTEREALRVLSFSDIPKHSVVDATMALLAGAAGGVGPAGGFHLDRSTPGREAARLHLADFGVTARWCDWLLPRVTRLWIDSAGALFGRSSAQLEDSLSIATTATDRRLTHLCIDADMGTHLSDAALIGVRHLHLRTKDDGDDLARSAVGRLDWLPSTLEVLMVDARTVLPAAWAAASRPASLQRVCVASTNDREAAAAARWPCEVVATSPCCCCRAP